MIIKNDASDFSLDSKTSLTEIFKIEKKLYIFKTLFLSANFELF